MDTKESREFLKSLSWVAISYADGVALMGLSTEATLVKAGMLAAIVREMNKLINPELEEASSQNA